MYKSEFVHVNADVCAGCRYCELICSSRDHGSFNPRAARIRVLRMDEQGIDTPILCRQCKTCPCVDACPTQAFLRTPTGTVTINPESCVACYRCVNECTEDAVFIPPKQGPPLVCDTCRGAPLCVPKCPTQALTLVQDDHPPRGENTDLPDRSKRAPSSGDSSI